MNTHALTSKRTAIAMLADKWNRHTNPAAMRSDFEHAIHNKAARKIMTIIKEGFLENVDYRFSESSGKILTRYTA